MLRRGLHGVVNDWQTAWFPRVCCSLATSCEDLPPHFVHVAVVTDWTTSDRLCIFSHVQVQSAVQESAAEQRQRIFPQLWPGSDAPGPGPAAMSLRCPGAGCGAGSLPVQWHHQWTREPYASCRSDQRPGKRKLSTDTKTEACSLWDQLGPENPPKVLHSLDSCVMTLVHLGHWSWTKWNLLGFLLKNYCN